jgi:hypothetical protein
VTEAKDVMSEKEIYLKERDVYMPEDSKVTETD